MSTGRAICLAIAGLFLGLHSVAYAQGSFEPSILRTGGGTSLQTANVAFTTAAGDPTLNILFGFASDEVVSPGAFKDSFTVSVSGSLGIYYLLTSDANGLYWAPVTAGALLVDTNALSFEPVTFAISSEGLPVLAAYSLHYTLPAAWRGVPLEVHFDLFDNLDTEKSLGYGGVVVVPEPASGTLLLLGMTAFRFLRYRRNLGR